MHRRCPLLLMVVLASVHASLRLVAANPAPSLLDALRADAELSMFISMLEGHSELTARLQDAEAMVWILHASVRHCNGMWHKQHQKH
jgi:hypothetical protein